MTATLHSPTNKNNNHSY